jgi:nitroreductase
MNLFSVMVGRRTIRRFSRKPVSLGLLCHCVDVARLAPSAANLQPFEYIVVADPGMCGRVFSALRWAAYLEPGWVPAEGERPTGYIVMIAKNASPFTLRDMGLAAGSIVMLAESEGVGSCILCNIDKEMIRGVLGVPEPYGVDAVIALGYKAEAPVEEDREDSVKYWRDDAGVLHVPKRPLGSVLHLESFAGTSSGVGGKSKG